MNPFWPSRLASSDRRAPGQRDTAPIFPRALRRDVLILISLKLAVLAAIYWLFFAPQAHSELRSPEIAAHLFEPQPLRH